MFSGDTASWWLPTAAVVAMSLVGLLAVLAQSARPAKKYWIMAVLLAGFVATVASAEQQLANAEQTARRDQVWARLGEIGGLPSLPAGATPDQTVEAIAGTLDSLNGKIKGLEAQLQAAKEKTQARTISEESGAKLAEFLRQSGSHRVVVSCVPEDTEAFAYANQIANVLRQAGWDALGPETTAIFGETPAMGVALYVRNGSAPPETARLLLDGFTKFNIPYQSGITPSAAIPDAATVEIFVGHKP
jgi:hypothetical protein